MIAWIAGFTPPQSIPGRFTRIWLFDGAVSTGGLARKAKEILMPDATFADIRETIEALPPCDLAIAEAVAARIAPEEGAAPSRSAEICAWLAGVQRRAFPRIERPRVAIYAATHGIAAGLPGCGAADVVLLVADMLSGGGEAHGLIEAIGGELKLYELAVEQPTGDSRQGPAMKHGEAALAAVYGMVSVEQGVDVLVVSALGPGADVAAAALRRALRDSGGETDPLDLLAALGGPDIAAMLGAVIAARFAGVPVILDGPAALAAAAVARRLRPDALDHCYAAATGAFGDALVGEISATPPPPNLPHRGGGTRNKAPKALPLDGGGLGEGDGTNLIGKRAEPPLAGIAIVPVLEAACRLLG